MLFLLASRIWQRCWVWRRRHQLFLTQLWSSGCLLSPSDVCSQSGGKVGGRKLYRVLVWLCLPSVTGCWQSQSAPYLKGVMLGRSCAPSVCCVKARLEAEGERLLAFLGLYICWLSFSPIFGLCLGLDLFVLCKRILCAQEESVCRNVAGKKLHLLCFLVTV